VAELPHEQHYRLLRATLNGEMKRFSPTRQLRFFVDAVRLSLGKSPIYMGDASNDEGTLFADERDWHEPGEDWDVVDRTNYVKSGGNAAAPRVPRPRRPHAR
jgi:hypothetical protein